MKRVVVVIWVLQILETTVSFAECAECDVVPDDVVREFVRDPDLLKRVLEARDAQFDRIEVISERVEKRGAVSSGLFDYRRGRRKPVNPSEDRSTQIQPVPEPRDVNQRYKVRLLFHGAGRTFEKIAISGEQGVGSDRQSVAGDAGEKLFWTNRSGGDLEESLFESSGGKPTYYRDRGAAVAAVEHHFEFAQFSMGIGLGSKLSKITNVSVDDESIEFVGSGDLSWWKGFSVKGTLDRKLILRDVVFAAKLDGGIDAILTAKTSDQRVSEGVPCVALSGSVSCSTSRGERTLMRFADYESTITEIRILTNKQYQEKATLKAPDDAYVVDSTRLDTPDSGDARPGKKRTIWRVWLFVAINVAILGIIWVLWKRSRRELG